MKRQIGLVCLCLSLFGCGQSEVTIVQSEEKFSAIENRVRDGDANNIHSLVVWQKGHKLFEIHRQGGGLFGSQHTSTVPVGMNELHNLHSVTKSFVATLIFIAIDEGKIAGLDTPVFSLFPEYVADDREEKMQIRIRDMLNMSTGYALNEIGPGAKDAFLQHYMAKDLLELFLSKHLSFTPGSQFAYSGLSTIGLSKIIERVYGKPFATVMKDKLFGPLSIDNYRWSTQFVSGEPGADWGLMLTPEGMGKFGTMWLNRGEYNGKQIVQSHWLGELSKSRFHDYNMGYGMHFWQVPQLSGAVAAVGIGEQYIMVIPRKNAVIVATGGNYDMPSMPTLTTLKALSELL